MMNDYLKLIISFLFIVLIHGQNDKHINNVQQPIINVAVNEHELSNTISADSNDQSWQTTTERTLIRVTRLESSTEQSQPVKRQRRQIIEAIQTAGFVINVAKAMQNTESGEEILGMAKKLAIAVIVITSLCSVCFLITTVIICAKCCCRKKTQKRNQGPTTIQVPQPIYVHTGPAGYQPQYQPQYQQQVPQTWSPESRPMLPQPSAPPQPNNHFHIEHPPPPYEKLYTGK